MPEFGRILFLSRDPAVVESQLAGSNVTLAEADGLRDDISTDEITPLSSLVCFDERLGRYPYTGVTCGDHTPIGVDGFRAGNFSVAVVGYRYGKGSSALARCRIARRNSSSHCHEFRAYLSAECGQSGAVHVN